MCGRARPASSRERIFRRTSSSAKRYAIEGEIARGGMGAVLRAVDGDSTKEIES